MKQKRISFCCAGLILLLAATLVGCKGNQPTPAAASRSLGDTYTSQSLDASYAGALNASSQLMLGMLRLEGTENAITAEQAATLLPVAQSLQGQVLKSDAERNAVLAYIEAQLTPAQSGAIVSMHLTQDDWVAWTSDNSRGPGVSPGQGGAVPRGTPGAPFASGGTFPGGGGTPPAMGTRPAQFDRGTPQAGGTVRGTRSGASTGSGQDTLLLNSLIRLLAQKSAGGAAPTAVSSRTPNRTPAPRSLPSPTPIPTSLPSPTPTKP